MVTVYFTVQALKYLEIGTCPASQKLMMYTGEKNSLEVSKFSLALQPEQTSAIFAPCSLKNLKYVTLDFSAT